MPLDDALQLLRRGSDVMNDGLVEVDHPSTSTLATQLGVSAYDARYLVLAQLRRTRLVTGDAELRRAAPELTCSLAEGLARWQRTP